MKVQPFVFLIFMLQILSSHLWAQNKDSCDCSVLVNPQFKNKIGLLNNSRKPVNYIQHNLKDEDYLILHITKSTDSLFYVMASYSIAGPVADGWVKKIDAIGIYARAYSGNWALYNMPDKKSDKIIISESTSQFLKVSACKYKWVKVSFSLNGKKYTGWLPPEMQCDNAYSTCN